ncbi:MAG: hypothetical protein KI792_05125 [Alphaproteobacteria bacterium]|nr:hypothetical protein [Alphaproteobacteria bacterium SS10]
MTQAFSTPINSEIERLARNYINPVLSLSESEFALRLQVAGGAEGIAAGFKLKTPEIDEGSIVGTKKSTAQKVEEYKQSSTKSVTHLSITIKASGDVGLLACRPTSGRRPPIEIIKEGPDLLFVIGYHEQTNDQAWEVVNTVKDILSDIEDDLETLIPPIQEEMVRKVEAKVRDIERDKAIEASITFPVKDG